jgi:hypothetical protein
VIMLMKRLILVAVVLLVLVNLVAVSYRLGWLAKLHIPGVRGPASSALATSAGSPPGGASPGAATTAGAGAAGEAPATAASQPGSATDVKGAAPLPAPPFDGNLASIDFGGTVESASQSYGDPPDHSYVIDGDLMTAWRNGGSSRSRGEIVLSFFGREAMVVDGVKLQCSRESTDQCPRDVEVWVSTGATPEAPFTKVAAGALQKSAEPGLTFPAAEARFLKFRMLTNNRGEDQFWVAELQAHEGQRAGYQPLMARHPELALAGGPVTLPSGAPVAAVQRPCAPAPANAAQALFTPPAHPESSRVLVVAEGKDAYGANRIFDYLGNGKLDDGVPAGELAVLKRAHISQVIPGSARPSLLAPALGVDTVVLAQLCGIKESVPAAFKQTLVKWVAAGHKLIIQDSDDCNHPGPDYSFLPYTFKADVPGALGAEGSDLRFIESNAMLHGRPGRPGFLDAKAWSGGVPPFRNELGDANTLVGWDGNWCGHLAVRNAHDVFGFTVVYAHYGRGLIIYEGFDNDQAREHGYDTVLVRELAQPFDPDNLPCAARLGDFVVTTDSWLLNRSAVPGRAYQYPLTLLSNQGYRGTVSLSASSSPGLAGLQARFDPASVALSGEGRSALTVTLPPGAAPPPVAVEVKGTDAAGKVNTLCLQLGPATAGELSVVSGLTPPTRTRKNLEIILDASGSMKTLLTGRKTRWDVALDTLQQVLAGLPNDFNVGLRIYGHRETSRSPKTCTDSELIVPIEPLNRQNVLNRAKAFKPKGETPLVYSALQSPADLKAVGGGTVILITDGEESCKGDTVKAAADLKASGLDIRLNIVGFALKDPRVQKDLAGFSQATGGLFYAADSGAALSDAVMVAAVEKFPYTVYDSSGKAVLTGEAGIGADQLPAGDYKVVVKAGTKELVAPRVGVGLGQSVTLTIAMKNGQLVLQ